MAVCSNPNFRIRQDEPYNQIQIQQICGMYDVSFIKELDRGDFKFYLFKNKHGDGKNGRSS